MDIDTRALEPGAETSRLKIIAQLCAATLTFFCAACTVGPDPHRPEVDTPAKWSEPGARAFDAALPSHATESSFDGQRWWSVFADPTLDHLVQAAVEQNLDLQSTGLRIAAARAQAAAAAGAALPSVDASGIGARSRMSENGIGQALSGGSNRSGSSSSSSSSSSAPPSTFNIFQAGFDAVWEIDLFGKTRRSVQAAEADVRSAQEARRDAQVSLTAEIARTYLSLRGSQQQYAIALADVATQEQLQRLVASRNRSGLAASSDVAAQHAEVATARAQLPPLEQAIAQSTNRLALLLALPPGGITDLVAQPPPQSLPPAVPIGLPGELLRRRPDIRQSEAEVESATARIGVATASLFPRVRLGLTGGLQATQFSDLSNWGSRFFLGGAQISLPIFEGGQLRAQVRIADLQAQRAVLSYRQTVLSAFHDVDNALIAYAGEQRRTLALEQRLGEALRRRELAARLYDAGLAAYIDVLDADRSTHQAALNLSQSKVEASTNLVALFKALGGGWDDSENASR